MKYAVTRQRAYWVEETQVVDADTPEEAEDRFLDWFDPTLAIKDVFQFGADQFATPIEVQSRREDR